MLNQHTSRPQVAYARWTNGRVTRAGSVFFDAYAKPTLSRPLPCRPATSVRRASTPTLGRAGSERVPFEWKFEAAPIGHLHTAPVWNPVTGSRTYGDAVR